MKHKKQYLYFGVALGAELLRFYYVNQLELNLQLATIAIVFFVLGILELVSHWFWGESH